MVITLDKSERNSGSRTVFFLVYELWLDEARWLNGLRLSHGFDQRENGL